MNIRGSIILASSALLTVASTALAQNNEPIYRQGIPTYLPVDNGNIEYQYVVYREIDTDNDDNAAFGRNDKGDYLTTSILSLILDGKVKAYGFSLNGHEQLNNGNVADIKGVMEDLHIPYVAEGDKISVKDFPADMVSVFYAKEMNFFDNSNSMWRTRLLALCPVLVREDDYNDGKTKYPMFWVDYNELEPYFGDIIVSVAHNGCWKDMTAEDYFVRNIYKGNIFKTFSPMGMNVVKDDTDIVRRLENMKKRTYDCFLPADSMAAQQTTLESDSTMPRASVKRLGDYKN